MATQKQRQAARANIKKAQAARRKSSRNNGGDSGRSRNMDSSSSDY